MKKIIAVVLATIALAGCGSKEEVYVCESSKFTVTENNIIASDENGSTVLDKEIDNVYSTMTPAGKMRVIKNDNKFTVSVSVFSVTKECKIAEGK